MNHFEHNSLEKTFGRHTINSVYLNNYYSLMDMIKGKDYLGVGCGAFILNENNELLLMKRNKNCRNKAGFWSIPGGGVRMFETLESAVKREIKEELNLDIEIVKLLSVTNDIIKEESQHWVSPQFLCKVVGGVLQNMEPHKCDEVVYFPLDALPDNLTNTTMDGVSVLKNIVL